METRNCSNSKFSNGYFDSDEEEDLEMRRRSRHIEHHVSKFDTLAGIAIKYGVDVADIKKLNGLSIDIQMFALKTLRIPLPGKHPPSPCLLNGYEARGQTNEQTPHCHVHRDLFDLFQSLRLKSDPQWKVSPVMNSLQGYDGLKPTDQHPASEGCEMVVHRKREAQCLEDGQLPKPSRPCKEIHRKTRSLSNFLLAENNEVLDITLDARENESDKRKEKLVRRRQKSEDNFSTRTPETLLREDSSNTGGVPASTGKGLALRPAAASRTASGTDTDTEGCRVNALGDNFLNDRLAVRKSSSTPSFQDEDASSSSCIWPLSSAAITKPIFDGLPNPKSGRKKKAALD